MIGRAMNRPLLDLLRLLGPPDSGGNVYLTGLIRVLLAADTEKGADFLQRIEDLSADPDRHTAAAACTWLSHERENAGDPVGAIAASQRALDLVRDEDGPWPAAMPRAILAQLCAHVGDREAAIGHARAALPVMERLGASDDEVQLRTVLVMCAIADGRLADAKDELARIDRIPTSAMAFGAFGLREIGRAELALASGDITTGLRIYRESADRARKVTLPGLVLTGTEPWALYADAMALCAHAYYAEGADEVHGQALARTCRAGTLRVLGAEQAGLDYPASGLVLFGLGAWTLLRTAGHEQDALRLLVLADRFAYNRLIPTMHWERIVPVAAERAAPGLLATVRQQYDGKRPPDLLEEVRRTVEGLPPG
jgi:hypothetical protein